MQHEAVQGSTAMPADRGGHAPWKQRLIIWRSRWLSAMECTMKESSLKPRAASTAMPQLQH